MMDFTEYKDIWVFIETDGGKAASVGLELLNPAAQLAHKTGQQAVAVILGKDNAAAEQEAAAYGADKILSVEDPPMNTTPPMLLPTAWSSWWSSINPPS